jgi:branched-chain amino acid transport system substrate-binding protein
MRLVGQGGTVRTRLMTVVVVGAALAAGMSLSVAGSGDAAAAASPFDVVVVAPVTGALASFGGGEIQGVKAAAQVLNASGGINGHLVKVEVLDDQGSSTTAAGLLEQRLASGTKPNLVVPGVTSTEGVALVPIASSAGVYTTGTPNDTSLNDSTKYPYEFLAAPDASLPATQLMQYLAGKGLKSLAMLTSSDAFGASTAAATQAAAKKAGIKFTEATYNDTDLDVTAQLEQLKAANPKALYFEGVGPPVGVILSSRNKLGWYLPTIGDLDASTTPLLSTSLVGTPQLKNVKVQVVQIQTYTPPAKQTQALKNFFKAELAQGPIVAAITVSSYNYDGIMYAALSAKQAKSIATPAMARAAVSLTPPISPPWVTLTSYKYTTSNHTPASPLSSWTEITPTHLVSGQYGAPGSS